MKKLGCAKCGGTKKMQKGGTKRIYGIPQTGMTGPNKNSTTETMQSGGFKEKRAEKKITKQIKKSVKTSGDIVKAKKYGDGGPKLPVVPNGTVMSDGRTYTNKRYSPKPVKDSNVPIGTKLSDGRTWDGKRYVKKGGTVKRKK